MKKFLIVLFLLAACLMCASACASPAITDGETTGWIAENNFLFLQNTEGMTAQLSMEIKDLIWFTDDELLCLAGNQQIIAVKKNGSGSRIVGNAEFVLQEDQQLKLENGVLSLKGSQVSASVCAAATDGKYIFYVEQNSPNSFTLRVATVQGHTGTVMPKSRDDYALACSGRYVAEPVSMTVTRDALTLTGKDHQVTVMNLLTGESSVYHATSEQTAGACLQGGMLYRYVLTEESHWILESGTALTTPTPTPAPTSAPTYTPKPTAKPTSYYDDDGTIHYGAYGKTVRKIQQRLQDLGYPISKIDGKYGDETQLAINLFCDAIHFREHNYITKKVQNRLFAKDAPYYDPYLPLKLGDRGVSVLYMQARLKQLGYDPGKLDGVYGKNTVAAVALFQRDFSIPIGEKENPGEVASHAMMELLYSPDPGPTPVPTTEPTAEPTAAPTEEPTSAPTEEPAPDPTEEPTPTPTPVPASQTDL